MGKYCHLVSLPMIFSFAAASVKNINRSSVAFIPTLRSKPQYPKLRPKFSSHCRLFSSSRGDLFENSIFKEEIEGNQIVEQIEVRDKAIEWCQANNIPEPDESVHHLMAHALDLPYESGYREIQQLSSAYDKQKGVTRLQLARFQDLLKRRATHEPLQYLIGQWDFLDFTLKIQPPLLCPRPETEELVVLVEEELRKKTEHSHVLDVGCGTGAIGIALAYHLPNLDVTAIDVESIAVEVSNENANRILNAKNSSYQACLSSAADFLPSDPVLFDCVVSNPPYIPKEDMKSLDKTVVNFEAWQALCGGDDDDGLQVINEIIQNLPLWLKPGGSCWMEVDPSQPEKLKKQQDLSSAIKLESVYQDMSGRDRFVKFSRIR